MQQGPDISRIAALIGERGRAEILTALMAGRALTATELARVAGVTPQTISSHLAKLCHARLIAKQSQGRHRYFSIASGDVANLVENLTGVAYRIEGTRADDSPQGLAVRKARVCYDHLAGELGVLVYDSLERRHLLHVTPNGLALTDPGWRVFDDLGIDTAGLLTKRRPVCRSCLDWSERRHHLAGSLGAALLDRIIELRWARRVVDSRAVKFSLMGEKSLRKAFGV